VNAELFFQLQVRMTPASLGFRCLLRNWRALHGLIEVCSTASSRSGFVAQLR
jgi:hypothetical protein